MENLIGLIIFIVFVVLSALGQKKPEPPQRRTRPPAQRPPVQEDDFFPIPSELRELLGLPPEEAEPVQLEASPEAPVQQQEPELFNPVPANEQGSVAASQLPDLAVPGQQGKRFVEPATSALPGRPAGKTVVIPGVGALEQNAVIQGVIWAEVLHNPRTRRAGRFTGHL